MKTPAPRYQIAKTVLESAVDAGDREMADLCRRSIKAYFAGKRDEAADAKIREFYAAM